MGKQKHLISIFGLVMINVAALGGIRNWSPIAEYGFSSVFFLVVGATLFLVPLSLICAELATTWPEKGGVYGWVSEAFGRKAGFLSIWLLWIQNVIWYPTALAIIGSMLTYLFDPALISNKVFMTGLTFVLFWGTTFLNLAGVRISSWVSGLGAVCGTFIPSVLLIVFGLIWALGGKSIQISFSLESLFPSMSSFRDLALFAGVIISLLGIEMSSVHAKDVKDPQRGYPKAIFWTASSVILFSSLGVLSIATLVPKEEILLNAGPLQAFIIFFEEYKLSAWILPMALMMAIGVIGSMSTWIIGPCKGFHMAAEKEGVSRFFTRTNLKNIPSNLLILQAVIVSILSLLFLWMPTINNAYWILLVLTTQIYLIMYLLLFFSAIRLRHRYPDVHRPFAVPGGKRGVVVCSIAGIVISVFAFSTCFLPPDNISSCSPIFYFWFLVASLCCIVAFPFYLLRTNKHSLQDTNVSLEDGDNSIV